MNSNKLLTYVAVLLAGAAIAFFTTTSGFSPQSIAFLIFFVIFIPTLINTDLGFSIIIVSMLFSPDLILGTTTIREITLRIEDAFLIIVVVASLLRNFAARDRVQIFKTFLSLPFLAFICSCLVSSVFANIYTKLDIKQSLFATMKISEYFMLFIVVKANIRSLRQQKIFVFIFLLTALMVSIHSNMYIQEKLAEGARFFRTSPPVATRGAGESGALGGYLLLLLSVSIGLLLYMRSTFIRMLLIVLILLMFRGFLYTLSRGSYTAFIPMLIALFVFSRRITFLYLASICIVLILLFMPNMVRQRIEGTIIEKESTQGTYIKLEDSPEERVRSWKVVTFEIFPHSPIFGYGLNRFFIDGQFFQILVDTGLVGLFSFVWICVRLFKKVKSIFYLEEVRDNEFASGLCVGFISGFIGLLVQAVSTNSFIIIRIMEPFWFLAAIVVTLPETLAKQKNA